MKELANLKQLMKENGLIANSGDSADSLEIIPFRNLIGPALTLRDHGETMMCEQGCQEKCINGCAESCADGCKVGASDGCALGCTNGTV